MAMVETSKSLAPAETIKKDLCHFCQKTVFPMEKLSADDKTFHKTCLKCACGCNTILSLGNFASLNGQFYSKPHFKKLFAVKGNYTDGFNQEKEPASSPASATTPASAPVGEVSHERVVSYAYGSPAGQSHTLKRVEQEPNELKARFASLTTKAESPDTAKEELEAREASEKALKVKEKELSELKSQCEDAERQVIQFKKDILKKEKEIDELKR